MKKKLLLSISLIVGLTALVWLNPVIYTQPGPVIGETAATAQFRAMTPQIIAYAEDGSKLWSGSGVWIDQKNILTAKHVVEGAHHWDVGGHKIAYATTDVKHDIAMLTIADGWHEAPVATISNERLRDGDEVMCVGWMIGLGQEVTWGRVANVASDPNGMGKGDTVCAIICTFGASGGPVFHDGKLVGIVSRGRDSLLIIEPITTFWLQEK